LEYLSIDAPEPFTRDCVDWSISYDAAELFLEIAKIERAGPTPMRLLQAFVVLQALVSSLVPLSETRLECLQSDLGVRTGVWEEVNVFGIPSPSRETTKTSNFSQYLYQPDGCRLEYFNVEKFCKKALRCKKLMIVGDSTTKIQFDALPHIFPTSRPSSLRPCKTLNGCEMSKTAKGHAAVSKKEMNESKGCHYPWVSNVIKTYHRDVCETYCGPGQAIISYFRNDGLINHNGKTYQIDLQCDEWLNQINKYDFVMLNFGPHIPEVIQFPRGEENPMPYNLTHQKAILTAHVNDLIATFKSRLDPNSTTTMIYQSGMWGAHDYKSACVTNNKPVPYNDSIVEPYANMFWKSIPLANDIFKTMV
jgi:hypothetical protein